MADEAEEPDDDVEGEDGEDGGGKAGGLKKKLLFIGLPVLLIVLLGSVAAVMLLGGGKKDTHAEATAEQAGEEGHGGGKGHEEEAAAPVYYELPAMLANIQNDDGETAVLKLVVLLEVDNEETIAKIEPLLPRIVDRYQGFLRELRMEDIKGSAGYYRLKLELLRRVNQAVAPVKINDLTIDTLLVN